MEGEVATLEQKSVIEKKARLIVERYGRKVTGIDNRIIWTCASRLPEPVSFRDILLILYQASVILKFIYLGLATKYPLPP